MVDVKPLNAIVYNQNKVDIKDVIAPPYDVITNEEQQRLYERSKYNIVRLILSSDLAGVPPDLAEVPSDLVVQANYSVADLTRCAAGKRETAAWAAEAAGENGG